MIGLGTIYNVAGILLGGILGFFFGKLMKDRIRDSLNMACGVAVLCLGIGGAMAGMLSLAQSGALSSGRSMFISLCLPLGALIGELINIEDAFERFGEWLKRKTGNSGDKTFVEAFVTASLTVCVGAMAIVGSIRDGIYRDSSILATKAVLDLVIILVMTCSLGKGAAFSAIPIAVVQGGMTLLASLIRPLMTDAALANISLIGSILIFCVGLNLVWGKKVRVANLLPSLILAMGAAFVFPTL